MSYANSQPFPTEEQMREVARYRLRVEFAKAALTGILAKLGGIGYASERERERERGLRPGRRHGRGEREEERVMSDDVHVPCRITNRVRNPRRAASRDARIWVGLGQTLQVDDGATKVNVYLDSWQDILRLSIRLRELAEAKAEVERAIELERRLGR